MADTDTTTDNLTAAERDRFAAWLEGDAGQTEALVEAAKLIELPATTIGRLKAEAAAARIVLRRLRSEASAEFLRARRDPEFAADLDARRRAAGDVS